MIKENKYFIFDHAVAKNFKYYIKRLVSFILRGYYTVLYNLFRPNVRENTKYNVCICAIFKNEGKYLKEWIEFHKIIGVEHFYLYNNNSTDNYKDVLKPYIEDGVVDLIDWPRQQAQIPAYIDCVKRFRDTTKWIGFIDIDEYIVPKKDDSIYDFLKKFNQKRGSVVLYWKVFGTSGRMDRDSNGLVCEDFITCWSKYDTIGKCFYNCNYDFAPELKENGALHHIMWTKCKNVKLPPVNMDNKICVLNQNPVKGGDFPIHINHYFTKSYEEYLEKSGKGDVYFKINPHTEQYFYDHEMKCTDVDYSAYKFLIKLKIALGIDK